MRRLYFLLPDETSCESVTRELEDRGVPDSHIHVLGSLEHDLKDLPEATVWETTELAHGIRFGLGLGGAAGLLGGLLAVTFPPAGLALGGGALLASTAAGAGLGVLVSALLGSQEHNHDLDAFQRAIDEGQLLMMVDVPRREEETIRSLVRSQHPEVLIGAVDSPRAPEHSGPDDPGDQRTR